MESSTEIERWGGLLAVELGNFQTRVFGFMLFRNKNRLSIVCFVPQKPSTHVFPVTKNQLDVNIRFEALMNVHKFAKT